MGRWIKLSPSQGIEIAAYLGAELRQLEGAGSSALVAA